DISLDKCLAHRSINKIRTEHIGVEEEVLHARCDRLGRNGGAGLGGHQQHDLASQSAVRTTGGEMPEHAPDTRRDYSDPGGLLWSLAHDRHDASAYRQPAVLRSPATRSRDLWFPSGREAQD